MEYFKMDGVDVVVRRVERLSGYSYRYRPIDNKVYLNVPVRTAGALIVQYAQKVIRSGREDDRMNDLRDGGFIRLFGEKIPLRVQYSTFNAIEETDDGITLTIVSDVNYFVIKRITDFYEKKLREYLKTRLPLMENYVGIKCSGWKIENRLSVWGCCNTKTKELTFAVNLVTQSPELIDMTIIHELTHILYPDHGAKFHAFMEKYVPGHREKKRRMKS